MASLFNNASENQSTTDDFFLSDGQRIARVIFLPLLTIIGVVGNLLVCIAVFKTPKLRKVVNYFIVSLAISDLLVCTIVMPLAIHQEYNHLKWGLERWVCRMWVALDVLLCTASIWNLCLVSADRYLAVVKPNQYAKWRTPRTAGILIFIVWFMALITTIMLHFGYEDVPIDTCVVSSNRAITVMAPLLAFYIPCLIMVFLYWRIYITIKDYTLRRRPSTLSSCDEASSTDTTTKQQINPSPSTSLSHTDSNSVNTKPRKAKTYSWRQASIDKSSSGSQWKVTLKRSNSVSIRREKKSAVVLAIVVASFIGCWLPFFIVYMLQLCKCADKLALPQAFNATTWLGWCNSLINPLIYTVFNKNFRKAFKKIVLCTKRDKSKVSEQDK